MAAKALKTANGAVPPSPLVIFSMEGRRYALALERVSRVVRAMAVTPLPDAPAMVLGVINLGGTVIPVINIRERFNHKPRAIRLSDHFIIASSARRTVALPVDETSGVIEAPPESLLSSDKILPGLELVEGAVKLDDGLVLIHDLDRLLRLDEEAAVDRAMCNAAGCGQTESGERKQ